MIIYGMHLLWILWNNDTWLLNGLCAMTVWIDNFYLINFEMGKWLFTGCIYYGFCEIMVHGYLKMSMGESLPMVIPYANVTL